MCRLAGYVGAPTTLASLLYDPRHALERQAYLPREMVSGTVNVDGTGIAWWSGEEAEPMRYVSERPPWSYLSFSSGSRSGPWMTAPSNCPRRISASAEDTMRSARGCPSAIRSA